VLVGGARDLPERQQTLRATLEWSHDLLREADRRLFRHLAVFVGGCTLEAAEAVVGGDPDDPIDPDLDTLGGLASLADNSLVRQEEQEDGQPRFLMLETIREYAVEQLEREPRPEGARQEEADAIRRRHAAYYLAFAEEAEPQLTGPEREAWVGRLVREHDNLRAALRWLAARGDAETGLRLAAALSPFWWGQGFVTEGLAHLRTLLALPPADTSPAVRAKALWQASNLAIEQEDLAAAQSFQEELVALQRDRGDPIGIAEALSQWGRVAREMGDFDRARGLFAESLALYRAAGHRLGVATQIDRLGTVAHALGDFAEAARRYEESRAIFEELGHRRFVIWSLHNQGCLALDRGDTAAARPLLGESLARRWEEGNRLDSIGSLALFACLAAAEGQSERALRLAGAAQAQGEALGARLGIMQRSELERWLERAWHALSAGAAETAWAEGRAMTFEQAVAYALDGARLPLPVARPSAAVMQAPTR
jgi:tetratricopeptide (TPR) repeat protein